MARIASGVLVAALLAGTVGAAVLTEKLKLTPSPVTGTLVDRTFSPVCGCATDHASISFRLRRGDVLTAEIIRDDGSTVRTLLAASPRPSGPVALVWNGRDDAGATVPEAIYKPRIRLHGQRRTITLPNPIRVDVTRPLAVGFTVNPRAISPDRDGRGDAVVVTYRLSERAQVALYVDGTRQVLRRGTGPEGRLRWSGWIDGRRAALGVHALSLHSTDLAGNSSLPGRSLRVVVRYIALGRTRIAAAPGGWFGVLVGADARVVRWELDGRSGRAASGTLRLRAPGRPGTYPLVVSVGGHTASAAVVVGRPTP